MTIQQLLASCRDVDVAIMGLGHAPLTFGGLRRSMEDGRRMLRSLGFRPDHRLGLVSAPGPHAAIAFLVVADSCVVAPLNPGLTTSEFVDRFRALGLSSLIVDQALGETGSMALEAAAAQVGLPIIRMQPSMGRLEFAFTTKIGQRPPEPEPVADLALLLQTSGTTAEPKIVPLTHANLFSSVLHIVGALRLGQEDRGLAIMPMFHIHGLVAGLLAPLAAGGSVWCAKGFSATGFFAALSEAAPTWYTAAPGMHQALLERSARNLERALAARLRFIRSSSAPLPPRVAERLEAVFAAPVIESYGMTEAAHQITSNPLPPGQRCFGSVGIAAGPRIAILSDEDRIVESAAAGEVLIKGKNVVAGYLAGARLDRSAFIGEWLRTGDLGVVDEIGRLRLVGRVKELINRGGETISPLEIDLVLQEHQAVAQALAFPWPHEMLGEEVAAAIVFRPGCKASEAELRDFARQRLAGFKVPRRIFVLDNLPTGPSGKPHRMGLAARLFRAHTGKDRGILPERRA